MKEESLNRKGKEEIQSKIDENKNSTSSEFIKEGSSINLSQDKSLFNQKYFPVKETFLE